MDQSRIRNFSIIAHIDHGKSTLADRILEVTETVSSREMRDQLLDTMELERERGITIKAQAVRVAWKGHQLNLIDTPGHVDFTYEVSRSLQACEGALLVVDAAQGIEAQTLANAYLAIENDLEIVPVVNKIDLPSGRPRRRREEVADLLGGAPDDVLRISAKTGDGVAEVLDAIVERIPPPAGDPDAPARALIFDSSYDQYRGVVAFVRVVDGRLGGGEALRAMALGTEFEAEEVGFFSPTREPVAELSAGEVGYVITGLKDVSRLRVGDTITTRRGGAATAAAGLQGREADGVRGPLPDGLRRLPGAARRAREAEAERRGAVLRARDLTGARLRLPLRLPRPPAHGDRPRAAGAGVRPRPARDRAERRLPGETPTGEVVEVHNPAEMPRELETVEEPYIRASIIVPKEYVGTVMELNNDRRGRFDHMEYLSEERVLLVYELPLAEVVLDYYDALKSRTKGYASFDYDLSGFREGNLVRVDVLVGGEQVDAAVARRPPRLRVRPRQGARREAAGGDPAPDVRRPDPGGDRVARDRARDRQGEAQGRAREVLRRRHHPQAEAAREAEGGQEADEAGRRRRGAAGGVPRRAQPRGREAVSGARHLYVHLPFCVHRCGYCDFVTVVGRGESHAPYVDALLEELRLERELLAPRLETVFLGGGTPTFTSLPELERLLAALPRAAEVTVEANPETVTA